LSSFGFFLASFVFSVIGALFAATDAAMGSFSTPRLAALIDQENVQSRSHLEAFRAHRTILLSRWLLARLTCMGITAILLAEASRPWAGRGSLVVGTTAAVILYGTLATLSTVLARSSSAHVGPQLLRWMRPLDLLFLPLTQPFALLGRGVASRIASTNSIDFTAGGLAGSEVEYLLEDAKQSGEMAAEPAQMIRNVLDLRDLTVGQVMVPRIKVVALPADMPVREAIHVVSSQQHSRYPIYRSQIDNVIGIVYAKDLFRFLEETADGKTLADCCRPTVNFVAETQLVGTILRDMRVRRQHLAIVVDEYGGMAGIITLEDILEEIVGDIQDEYDDGEEQPVQDLGDGVFLANADVSLDELASFLGTALRSEGDYESLGGLLIHHAGRVPATGDRIVISGLEFFVREADAKRVIKVEICRVAPAAKGNSSVPPATSSSL